MSDPRPVVTAVFEDERTAVFPAGAGQTVYAAALAAGLRLEHDCLEGACGTCKALCTQGWFTLDDYVEEALSAEEEAAGHVLTCRMRPSTSCVLEFPYPHPVGRGPSPALWQEATLSAVERVAADVWRFACELAAPMAWLPGQYAHVRIPGTDAVRYYSFANVSGTSAEFFARRIGGGAMSEYLAGRAKPGDRIALQGPFGHFYLRPPVATVVMVAGGTGLAPMLAMLADPALAAARVPVVLLYGTRDASEWFAADRLDAASAALQAFQVERIAAAGGGRTGLVTDLIKPALFADGECDVYLCGPPAMIDASRALARLHGVPETRIRAERFLPSQ